MIIAVKRGQSLKGLDSSITIYHLLQQITSYCLWGDERPSNHLVIVAKMTKQCCNEERRTLHYYFSFVVKKNIKDTFLPYAITTVQYVTRCLLCLYVHVFVCEIMQHFVISPLHLIPKSLKSKGMRAEISLGRVFILRVL